jgi:hypothetical protein
MSGRPRGNATTIDFKMSLPPDRPQVWSIQGGSNVNINDLVTPGIWAGVVVAVLILLRIANIFRYISNNQVGIVEKMWATKVRSNRASSRGLPGTRSQRH